MYIYVTRRKNHVLALILLWYSKIQLGSLKSSYVQVEASY